MPFRSKSQMRTCFGGGMQGMSEKKCREWIRETKDICCLPEKVGFRKSGRRCSTKKQKISVSRRKSGPRGGRYVTITQTGPDKRCSYKVYVSSSKRCKATTKAGDQCKKTYTGKGKYCSIHSRKKK